MVENLLLGNIMTMAESSGNTKFSKGVWAQSKIHYNLI